VIFWNCLLGSLLKHSSSLRDWIENPLISRPLLGNFMQKLLLCDDALVDEPTSPALRFGRDWRREALGS